MKHKKLVLIVDDNPENRKLLGSLLDEQGYEIGVASDGKTALDFVKQEHPDLILLDIMMPGMDGLEVCRNLKLKFKTKHIPVIFITAKTNPEDIVKGFDVGGVDYISKPFNNAELLARVRTHIEMKILKGLLPICSSCKKIRNDEGYWQSIEAYIQDHSDALFSHGLCDKCIKELYGKEDWVKKISKKHQAEHLSE